MSELVTNVIFYEGNWVYFLFKKHILQLQIQIQLATNFCRLLIDKHMVHDIFIYDVLRIVFIF